MIELLMALIIAVSSGDKPQTKPTPPPPVTILNTDPPADKEHPTKP